jgi:DNA-binding NarL/FixJ family response regulator
MSPPLRVMLVDDHALVRSAVRQAITSPDIEVVAEAASAEEALSIAPAVRPDVLLLDIDLPGLSGMHVLRELAPRLPDTTIVMLTVSGSERDLIEAVRAGARGYLTKDLAPDALLRAILGTRRGDLAMPRRLAAKVVDALARAPRPVDSTGGRSVIGRLSERELDVLRLLAQGLTDREIAEALTVSTRTVESHVGHILRKLDARNRAEAAQRYRGEALPGG